MKRLLVINGHPDPRPERYCGALARAYVHGATQAGWETRRTNIGDIALGAIEAISQGEEPGDDISKVLSDIGWANRLAIVFPLWFDKPPEALRAIFARLGGTARRAHTIVTMDMPAFAYRSLLRPGASSQKSLALSIPGVVPDEPVLIGCVSSITQAQRHDWLDAMRGYGNSWAGASAAPTWTLSSMFDRTVSQLWG